MGNPVWLGISKGGADDPKSMPPGMDFVAFNSDGQQQYVMRALDLGQKPGIVGPMFLNNLNACEYFPPGNVDYGSCFCALFTLKEERRPVYDAIKALHNH